MSRMGAVLAMVLLCHPAGFAEDAPVLAQPLSGKYLHVLGGMVTGLVAAGVVNAVADPAVLSQYPWVLPATAMAGSAIAGIAKEVLDSTGFGDPQLSDILITSTGGVVAALVLISAQSLYPPTRNGQVDSSSFVFSLAVLLALPVINGFLVEIGRHVDRRAPRRARRGTSGNGQPEISRRSPCPPPRGASPPCPG